MRYLPAPDGDKETFLSLVASGLGIRAALAELGYDVKCAARWSEKDPTFAERLESAREASLGQIEKRLDDRILKKLESGDDLTGAETNLIMFRMKQRDNTYRESSPGVHIHAKIDYQQLDASEVRKVLQEAGALDVIDGEIVSEDTGRELPRAEVLPPQGDS